MRPDIPTFLWRIGTAVENLIQQHNALEHWRDCIRRWAPEETSPTDLTKILYSRSLDAKFAILAAIHDLCFDPNQVPPINPWPDDVPLEVAQQGISYLILKGELLPDAERGHRGLNASESDRLQIILDDVIQTLPTNEGARRGETLAGLQIGTDTSSSDPPSLANGEAVPPSTSRRALSRKVENMQWLIEEVFRPAVDIAQMLADADWNPGDVLTANEYHDARGRLQAGLRRANEVRKELPYGDVSVAVQTLQMDVRGLETINDSSTAAAAAQCLHIAARLGWVAILHHLPPGSPVPPRGPFPCKRRRAVHGGGLVTDEACADVASTSSTRNTKPDTTVRRQDQGKRFRVALSFPGEHRQFVVQVADILADRLERCRVFYDKYYEAELARPNLDTYLQRVYHDDSDLIAVFLCAEYEKKDWCGLEWRAIRDLIKTKHSAAIMPFRFDNTSIPGLFSIDGYVEIGQRSPSEVASLILERLNHNDHANPSV